MTLDRQIAAALTEVSHGELGRTFTLASNACLNRGRSARGIVLLQIVFSHCASGKKAESMCDTNHIQKITLKGELLEAFNTVG